MYLRRFGRHTRAGKRQVRFMPHGANKRSRHSSRLSSRAQQQMQRACITRLTSVSSSSSHTWQMPGGLQMMYMCGM